MISRKLHLDAVGFTASLLCAIHCAALPLVLSIAPLAGQGFLSEPWVEFSMIALSIVVASYSLLHGFLRHHHKLTALMVMIAGFVLIGLGHTMLEDWQEVVATSLGATLVAISHLINWKYIQQSADSFPACLTINHRRSSDEKP